MATYEELLNESAETGDEAATPAITEAQEQEPQGSPESLPETEVKDKQVPLKALETERHKRQSFEQQVAAQQRQIDALIQTLQTQQVRPAAAPQPVPDMLLEPEKWQKNLFGAVENMLQSQIWQTKVALSEDMLRETKVDYDEVIDTYFKPALQQNPALAQQLASASNPAKFAYQYGKRAKTEQEFGGELDADKLKAQIKAQVRAEILAELEGKKAELDEKVKIPVSLGSVGTSAPADTDKIPPGGSYRARDLYG